MSSAKAAPNIARRACAALNSNQRRRIISVAIWHRAIKSASSIISGGENGGNQRGEKTWQARRGGRSGSDKAAAK